MEHYTDKKFWDEYFNRREHKPTTVENSLFSDIFDKYLVPDKNKTVLEIGCADSNFLCYLSKKFGYQAYGIDYSEAITRTTELFKFNGLPEPKLYKEDLFSWNPDIKFDMVCSFGFIEHFDDINPVIKKHAELIAPGGKLIVTPPHFAHAQYTLHWIIDRKNLEKHNTRIMNLRSIKKAIMGAGLKIEYLSYYKTFGFWTEDNQMSKLPKTIYWLIIKSGKVITKIFGYDRPNFLFSPHIICVARKI